MKIEPFALERWMTTYELDAEYDITESGIQPLTLNDLLALMDNEQASALREEIFEIPLGYSEARGSAALRQELASTYKETSSDQILVTTGAIEANFLLFNALLEAGDHVVAIHPAYQQLYSVPRAIGCDVDLWKLSAENDFAFDLDALEQLVRPETKLIVINTPHNPTGSALTTEELRRIYALAESVDAWLLCDEAYRWLQIPGQPELPGPAKDLGPRALSVGTFSKPFGLPGLRIGWFAGPEDLVQQCWGLRDYITLSPGKLNDRLALAAFRSREKLLERNSKIIAANLETVRRWAEEQDGLVHWVEPEGGLLTMLAYQLDVPSQDLANRLAEEYSVMLAPGSAFDFEYHLRLGLGQRPDIFAAGLDRTAACFKDLQASGTKLRS